MLSYFLGAHSKNVFLVVVNNQISDIAPIITPFTSLITMLYTTQALINSQCQLLLADSPIPELSEILIFNRLWSNQGYLDDQVSIGRKEQPRTHGAICKSGVTVPGPCI